MKTDVPTKNPKHEAFNRFIQFSEVKETIDRLASLQEHLKFQSVAVLSEYVGEGKTFFAAALACGYAATFGRKVLIVDTTTPHLSSGVPVSSEGFLQEVLDQTSSVDVMKLRELNAPDFDRYNEYQLKKALLSQVSSQYDLILVDTSAMDRKNRNNLDPVVIARQCDTSVLISSRSTFDRVNSEKNRARLHSSGVRLIGTIHNHFPENRARSAI